ncbi:MAG: hypothetical protein KZQ74_13705 [gamma proteobacterium symbiont of Bathyaustriella thionipta]|nr:hypothetical protein [gamma proteobacterium symbiont of Bathyaustriella thionipta]MCU7957928.1 hypothetical protein [gamma proteobacterium symbiont of Bathyaustriella thionipta]MCU7968226.1 hypothetical protein [gamma proteobacterium symbiont of Bathyaustriella thionipta]
MKKNIKKISYISLFLIQLIFIQNSYSFFGFGKCCGKYYCGIIPCDSSCSGSALESFGSSMNDVLSDINDAYQDRNDELVTSINNTGLFNANTVYNMGYEMSWPGYGNLYALDSFTQRVIGEVARSIKANEDLTNHIVNSTTTTYKNKESAKEKKYLENAFGKYAQPVSGDVSVDRAELFKKAIVEKRQVKKDILTNMVKNNEKDVHLKGMGTRYKKDLLEKFTDEYNFINYLSKNQLSSSEYEKLIAQITILTDLEPLSETTAIDKAGGGSVAKLEVEKRLWNSRTNIVRSALVDDTLNKTQLIDKGDWMYAYASNLTEGDKSKVSIYDFLSSEADGRIMTPGWFQNIKETTSTGLKREESYIDAIINKSLYELMLRKNSENQLSSILGVMQLHEKEIRPEL